MTLPQAVLEISGADGLSEFPGLLVPNDYVVVNGLPVDRLKDVATGRIMISSPDAGLEKEPVSTAGMRVFPDSNGEKAIVMIKLGLAVADVSIDLTGDQFHSLVDQNNGDVAAALDSVGINTTQLLDRPWKAPTGHKPDRPQPPYGWAPYCPPGETLSYGPCCWWWFCTC